MVGLFFGSFNPPHRGHTELAINILDSHPEISEIWFIVKKFDNCSVSFSDRLEMTKLACQVDPRLIACDIDKSYGSNSIIDTSKNIKEDWPNTKFALIIGEDLLILDRSYFGSENIIIYPRDSIYCSNILRYYLKDYTKIEDLPKINISSQEIRLGFKKDFLDEKVLNYINLMNLYSPSKNN